VSGGGLQREVLGGSEDSVLEGFEFGRDGLAW